LWTPFDAAVAAAVSVSADLSLKTWILVSSEIHSCESKMKKRFRNAFRIGSSE
jgi:hypothetical protein